MPQEIDVERYRSSPPKRVIRLTADEIEVCRAADITPLEYVQTWLKIEATRKKQSDARKAWWARKRAVKAAIVPTPR